ncbi:hypothetical protein [Afifella aestuarii]|nr:hypothetical protein [Afifella aestuarii]
MPRDDMNEVEVTQAEERNTNRHVLVWGTVLAIVALGAIALWFGL